MTYRGTYRLHLADSANDLLSGVHPQLKKKIRAAFEALLRDPHSGKGLHGELAGLWSYRVGPFRIIYRLGARRQVEIVALGPRDRIYEETYRLIRAKAGR